ncbi:MAG: O-antigen ligase family protein [Stellaceae bacterium]
MQINVVAAAYGGWLFLINIVFYLVHGHGVAAEEASVLAGIAPMLLQLLLIGFNPIGMRRPANVMLAFLAIILLSYLFNGAGWVGVTYLVLFLYLCFGAIVVAGSPDRRLLSRIAEFYSIPTAIWLLYIDRHGSYLWGRLDAGLQSNVWGLMAVSVAVAAFAHRSRATALFCIASGALTMYLASSRSSMLGLAAALGVLGVQYLRELRNRKLIGAVLGIAVVLLIAAAAMPALQHGVMDFANSVWKVDDPRRGFGTGASGRALYWQAALDLWWKHPVFGVGYRMHELYMPGGYESHNAYLAMLADTGLCGLIWYVGVLAAMWRGMFKIEDPRLRRLAIGLAVSYSFIGLFERRAIDGGNPMGWLFLMGAAMILRDGAIGRVERALARRIARHRDGSMAVPQT